MDISQTIMRALKEEISPEIEIFSIDEARDEFDKGRYFRYLNTRNVRGFRREKTEWSPGSGKNIPKLNNFVFILMHHQ